MPQPRPARPAAAPARRTFLLGLGCEKGGTTWLYDYLERHPQVASGFSKEYHVLNAHFLASGRALQERRIARVRRLIAGLRRVPGQRRAQRLQGLAAMLAQRERQRALAADLGAYVDYFAGLADAAPDTRLVCDITPLYACLDAAALAEVRARLEAAGFEVRVIFIMRDPIERAFSSYRMSLGWTEDYAAWLIAPRLGAAQRDLQAWAEVAAGRLRQALARSPEARRRASPFLRDALEPVSRHCSSYERTIAAAEAAFPASAIHYGFFETLFREADLRAITDFLGLDFRPAAYAVSRNPGRVQARMSAFEIATLREAFAGTYDFAAERFGADFIRGIWRHY